MAEDSKGTHSDELQSDLDLLVEMAKEPKQDEEAIRRHLESLKTKLDAFVDKRRSGSGGGSAA
jgi:hypothetical protein